MKPWRYLSLLTVVCGALAGFYYVEWADKPAPAATAAAIKIPLASTLTVDKETPTHYFFDVYGHSAAEIKALLNRAKETHDSLPADLQDDVRIAMVLHGPDVAFFATDNYEQYKDLVDLAAKLDAFGFVDLKACAASIRSHGLQAEGFPPFIELVPYGPAEVSRLRSAGYVQL
jgi:intracellular sulfur oxidation DsrE/DsrF family protein